MSDKVRIDLVQVRRYAGQLSEAAADLNRQRGDLLSRLANGDGVRPVEKSKDNVRVTLGIPPFEHSGSRAGELVAQKLKSCGDAYTTVEDGLRALSTVMSKMARSLEDGDTLNQDELNAAVEGLYCVVQVVNGQTPEPIDWFGVEQS